MFLANLLNSRLQVRNVSDGFLAGLDVHHLAPLHNISPIVGL